MTLSVRAKLGIAFIGLTIVVLAATLTLARWSFERGFLDYVNALEQTRLNSLQDRVVAHYDPNTATWDKFGLEALLGPERRGKRGKARPPHEPWSRPGPHRNPKGRPPPPHVPTALMTVNREIIAGNPLLAPESEQVQITIEYQSQPIAILASIPRNRIDQTPETAFSVQQLQATWLIGGLALLAALIVSILLSRFLTRPLTLAVKGVNTLALGDYSHRIDSDRSDEFGELTRDLDRLARTLEENLSARNRWIADISHELRTPVAILRGELDAIQDGLRKPGPKEIESLNEETVRLAKLIEDLYQLSLADVGGLSYEFETIDMADLIQHQLETFKMRHEHKGFEITATLPERALMEADSRRISQLLSNLLENSIAYTDRPGRIQVELIQTENNWSLIVQDSAPGVPAADCMRLFDPLHRQETSRNRRAAGAGLGLAICKNIVEAHGGTIHAEPSPLGGLRVMSRFWSQN